MIAVEGLAMRQGGFALRDITLRVPAGGYAVLMGATGCGKTSIVEAVCGLRPITAGCIAVGARDVTRERPGNRGLGYVPQDGALFSTMTVREHLAFPLKLRRWSADAIAARVAELTAQLALAPLLDRRPHGLRGGERQRVAIGRALSFHPAALLLDEPLASLDETTQDRLRELLREVHRSAGVTVLHVTHNRAEAEQLATVRFHLADGKIQEDDLQTQSA